MTATKRPFSIYSMRLSPLNEFTMRTSNSLDILLCEQLAEPKLSIARWANYIFFKLFLAGLGVFDTLFL
jgi:hypothetical protein